MSAAGHSVVDGLRDGSREVDDLTRSVATTGDIRIPWLRSDGDGLGSSSDHTSRLGHGEGESVGTSGGSNPSGGERSNSGRCNGRCRERDPGLFVSQALSSERTSTAFGNVDDLSAAAILLDTTSVAKTATVITWDGQRTKLVVWGVEVFCDGEVNRSGCWNVNSAVDGGSGCWSNIFREGRRPD